MNAWTTLASLLSRLPEGVKCRGVKTRTDKFKRTSQLEHAECGEVTKKHVPHNLSSVFDFGRFPGEVFQCVQGLATPIM